MDAIEAFFRERGAGVFHEVSPLADPTALSQLNERGYQPMEFTSVMYRPISSDLHLTAARNERIDVRLIRDGEQELWAETSAKGWSEFSGLEDFMLGLGQVTAKKADALSFFAEVDG